MRLPLTAPYHLSYGDLDVFDTVLAWIRTDAGEGWGETTPLAGYSEGGGDDAWRRSVEWARTVRESSVSHALAFLDARAGDSPFECAALATALEQASRGGVDAGGARVPLIGTIRSARPDDIAGEASRLIDAGYGTLKLKVGMGVAEDLAAVAAAQRGMRSRGLLRLDANQGYTLDDARAFCGRLDPSGIQLLEQPFPVDRWDWMEHFGGEAPVPLMLDESIADDADLERARRLPNVRYVKFKLMKAGSARRLRHLVARAAALGFGVVVGNGVASDVGCLHEAEAVADRLALAGEMNGFLKLVEPLLAAPLRVERGALVLPPSAARGVLRERIDRYLTAAA